MTAQDHSHGGLVIDAVGLSKSFRARGGGVTELLSDASLQVQPWTTVAVMGRSGAGKSTLLRALGLFQPFDSGTYRLLGSDVAGAAHRVRLPGVPAPSPPHGDGQRRDRGGHRRDAGQDASS